MAISKRLLTTINVALLGVFLAAPATVVAAEADKPAGTPAQLAALGGDAFTAMVTRVVRKVEWQRFRTRIWQPAGINNLLMVGDTLRTGPDAKAELLYGDGSITRIGSHTSLTLSGEDKRTMHLDSGRVWMHIIKHNAGMKIITPGAVAAVTGTELMVEYDPLKRATEVTVFEGAVNVSGDVGNLVKVLGGSTTLVPFQAPAAAPVPLDNTKLQERENIFRPLSVKDSGTQPDTTSAPVGNATPDPTVTTGPNPTSTSAPVAENQPQQPVQPDLKGQTEKLMDPRVINGSPTTGSLKIIIK
jgi:hypothetical protein